MGKRRLKFHDLRRILRHFGVVEERSRGKGDHILFTRSLPEGKFSYPIPDRTDVKPCYVKGVRRRLMLLPEDGVSDEEFYRH